MKLLVSALILSLSSIALADPVMIFNNVHQNPTPSGLDEKMPRISIVYKGTIYPANSTDTMPDLARVGEIAAKADRLLVWDIEHLASDPREQARVFDTLLDVARGANPHVRMGFYSMFPVRDYWRAIKNKDTPDYQAWWKQNTIEASREWVRKVDAVFPSLYTFYKDQDGWQLYAERNLEAARLANKPIYAYIWPYYHDSNEALKFTYIGDDYLRMQIQFVLDNADGVVLWSWSDRPWDSDLMPATDWENVVREFLELPYRFNENETQSLRDALIDPSVLPDGTDTLVVERVPEDLSVLDYRARVRSIVNAGKIPAGYPENLTQ